MPELIVIRGEAFWREPVYHRPSGRFATSTDARGDAVGFRIAQRQKPEEPKIIRGASWASIGRMDARCGERNYFIRRSENAAIGFRIAKRKLCPNE